MVRLDAFGVKPERTVTNYSVLRSSPAAGRLAGAYLALRRTSHHLGSRNRGSWPCGCSPGLLCSGWDSKVIVEEGDQGG